LPGKRNLDIVIGKQLNRIDNQECNGFSIASIDKCKFDLHSFLKHFAIGTSIKMTVDPHVLFKEGEFTFRILSKEYRDEALVVLSRAFCTEPVCDAIAEIDPKMKTNFLDWVEFVDYWMDHCSTNGMSVVALHEKSHRIAGVFIVRDLLMKPPGFEEKYSSDEKTLTPWMQFLWHMDAEATKIKPELGEPGKAVDLWFLGVHPDFRGNKIANHLIRGILPLVKKSGFKYATIEATSFFTSKAAAFNDFEAVYQEETKNWTWKGQPLYINAKPPHGTWIFWVKDLDTV